MGRFFVLLFLLNSPVLFCQSIPDKVISDIRIAVDDGVALVSSPFHMDGTDAEYLGLFTATTAILVGGDNSTMDAVRHLERTKTLDQIMDLSTNYADSRYALILPAGLYLGGLLSGEDEIRTTGRQIFQALIYSTVITQTMKLIVGRARPGTNQGPYSAKLFNFSEPRTDDYFSMPSGHTTVAFAVSSVLAETIDNIYASIGLYGLATMTGISRMYHNRHWLSDAFVGAVIGTATGVFVTNRNSGAERSQSSPLRIIPGLTGMRLEYRF